MGPRTKTLTLDGVNIKSEDDCAIYSDEDINIVLAEGSVNNIIAKQCYDAISCDNNLTISGKGTLNISNSNFAINAYLFSMLEGTLNITYIEDEQTHYYITGIDVDEFNMTGGTININGTLEDYHSTGVESDNISISGGTFNIDIKSDASIGLHGSATDSILNISGGNVNINTDRGVMDCGIQINSINISGGNVKVLANDCAINSFLLTITDGYLLASSSEEGGAIFLQIDDISGEDTLPNIFKLGSDMIIKKGGKLVPIYYKTLQNEVEINTLLGASLTEENVESILLENISSEKDVFVLSSKTIEIGKKVEEKTDNSTEKLPVIVNPKTGETSNILAVSAFGISLLAVIALKKRSYNK